MRMPTLLEMDHKVNIMEVYVINCAVPIGAIFISEI
jgi:hypothetical protein